MENKIMSIVNQEQMKSDLPVFKAGDHVKVHFLIKEDKKDRIQIFEGLVISRKGAGIKQSFTVRKMISNNAIEKTFPLHSPKIKQIDVMREGRVRRAKIFYIRGLKGKQARIPESRKTKRTATPIAAK